MDKRQEHRRDQPTVNLGAIIIWLRVVAVDFADGCRGDVVGQQFPAAADGEPEVGEAALIAAPPSVANDDRQSIHTEVVAVRPGHCTPQQESPIAAADVEDNRS